MILQYVGTFLLLMLCFIHCGLCFFFFFQAEDGIRDLIVTGVQTCALPIWEPGGELFELRHAIMRLPIQYREPLILQVVGGFSTEEIARELTLSATAVLTRQIGRASCRERV